jgi:hypothetical protein
MRRQLPLILVAIWIAALFSVQAALGVPPPCKPVKSCPKPSPTVAATVVLTAAPTAGARPFAPPVTTATYTVPGTIDATGTTDVYVALNNWINSVPNGSVLQFPANATYKLSQGIKLGNRDNLVFAGNGTTLTLTGAADNHQASGFLIGFSYSLGYFTGNVVHVTIDGFNITGNDPTPGTFGGGENQQAVRCNGSTYIELTNVTVSAVYGDGAFLDGCDDVWVHGTHVVTAGRNGLTVIKGQRVLGESNAYDTVGYATFDLEPNLATEASADVTFRNNTAGTWQSGIGFVSVDGAGRGADIQRVTIIGNTVTGMALQVYVDNRGGVNGNVGGRMRDVTTTDNHGPAGGVLRFAHIDGLTVRNNDGTVTITDCTGVVTS